MVFQWILEVLNSIICRPTILSPCFVLVDSPNGVGIVWSVIRVSL